VMHFSITKLEWQENLHRRALEESKALGANPAPGLFEGVGSARV
jgi:hypothetical protein